MRVSWEEFWRARAVLGLLLGSLCAAVAQVSPCPAYFNYTQRNGVTVGEIELPAEGSGKHVISVRLSVKTELPTRYRGEIELMEEKGEHIRYLLRFPLQSPLPKVTSISHDSKILCRGEPEKLDGHGYAVHNWGIQYPLKSKISLNQKQQMSLKSNHNGSRFPCGILRPQTLNYVVNGLQMAPEDRPWLVTVNLKRGREYLCTGALVSPSVVITAAHCVYAGSTKRKPSEMLLEFGVHDRVNNRDNVVQKYVRSIELPANHEVVSPPKHDLAVLVLDKPIEYSNTVIPVCLWTGDQDLKELIATKERGSVVGWGLNELNNADTTDPQLIKLPIVKFDDCTRFHEDFGSIARGKQYCAGTADGFSGVCNGDSGGGMFFFRNDHWELKGVVSFVAKSAKHTCDLNKYVVFTDVSNPEYKTWITDIINAEADAQVEDEDEYEGEY